MWPFFVIWGAVIVIAIIIEINTVTLTSIWFAVAGVVSLLLALFNVNIIWQIVSFVALTSVLLASTRPLTKRMMNRDLIRTNADKVISMIGIVTRVIPVGEVGEVKVNSELWRAISIEASDIEAGESVIVNSINGNKVLVSRIKKEDNIDLI